MKKPTPETDAVAAYEGNWDTKALRMTVHARKLERERDEVRRECKFLWDERDEARELLASEKITRNHIIKRSVEVERERDEARQALKHIEEYGTEEINAAVELRQKLATALVERDEVQKAVNGLCEHFGVRPANTTLLAVEILRIQREREEAITRRMETIMQCELYEQERDEAREALASEIALADRLAHNLKIASHAWNNPTEHPAITDWKKARHE